MPATSTALIAGASRGLGLALAARADPACGSLIATGKFCPDEINMDERE